MSQEAISLKLQGRVKRGVVLESEDLGWTEESQTIHAGFDNSIPAEPLNHDFDSDEAFNFTTELESEEIEISTPPESIGKQKVPLSFRLKELARKVRNEHGSDRDAVKKSGKFRQANSFKVGDFVRARNELDSAKAPSSLNWRRRAGDREVALPLTDQWKGQGSRNIAPLVRIDSPSPVIYSSITTGEDKTPRSFSKQLRQSRGLAETMRGQ
eukprot:CAMPEP_0184689730 /NCGR_PEP_ID=MMETSP0312-20130426/30821_1 /TAXON_ID=31354 /ORGANISM="Compsopogon coeruleus, Strain SAG 36.94" /LENGTH=211 /DNA_ID=CAMNT_0027147115 /DNA_START=49 /DNA_END=684 /DNA_ORIENTATION=+